MVKLMFRSPALIVLFSLLCSHAAAQDRQGARSDSAFALSAGAAYSRLPDVDFEVVASLAGQDLFSQVSARESTTDLAVFLSQRVWADEEGPLRAYASLGTGLRNPGSILYFGGTLGISRTLVTLGVATMLVEQGVGPAPDNVFRGTGDRTLFSSLERGRKWAVFVAVSFGVIQ
jgi:hypothetical protein